MTSCVSRQQGGAYEDPNDPNCQPAGISGSVCVNHVWPVVAGGGVMTTEETLDLALEVLQINLKLLEKINPYKGQEDLLSDSLDLTHKAITAIKQARSAPVCNPHPKAPHGFNRSASHSADRYVCDCEGWDAYDAGYQAGIEDTYKRMDALDKKAENARELGLDYEPADGTQVSKVWWDGEKLMAKPIPLVDFYRPVQDSTCSETLRAQGKAYPRTCRKCGKGPCIGAPKPPPAQPAPAPGYCKHCKQYSIEEPLPAAQRQWVGLTDEEIDKTPCELYAPDQGGMTMEEGLQVYARAIEAKLKEKNT